MIVETRRELRARTRNGSDLCARAARSAELDAVVAAVLRHLADGPHVKVLVFCEWLREIALLGDRISADTNAPCLQFIGKMGVMERVACMQRFEQDPAERVLLVQIRAGGCGVNLQAASRVIITSPSWNPCQDLQAIGRAYRRGQRHAVLCERFVIRGTVEEQCLRLQHTKVDELDKLFEDGEKTLCTRLGFLLAEKT